MRFGWLGGDFRALCGSLFAPGGLTAQHDTLTYVYSPHAVPPPPLAAMRPVRKLLLELYWVDYIVYLFLYIAGELVA